MTAHALQPATPHRGEGPESERILIFDFGSQYGQLIARRVREQNVFCQIVRHDLPAERVARAEAQGPDPLRRPGQRLRAGRPAVRPGDLRPGHPGPRHLLRHAARLPGAGRRGASRRRAASSAGPICRVHEADGLFAGVPDGDRRLDEPRRPGADASTATSSPLAATDTCPVAAVRHRDAAGLRPAVPPRGQPHAVRRPDPAQLPLRGLRLPGHCGRWQSFIEQTVAELRAADRQRTASSAACPAASIRR